MPPRLRHEGIRAASKEPPRLTAPHSMDKPTMVLLETHSETMLSGGSPLEVEVIPSPGPFCSNGDSKGSQTSPATSKIDSEILSPS